MNANGQQPIGRRAGSALVAVAILAALAAAILTLEREPGSATLSGDLPPISVTGDGVLGYARGEDAALTLRAAFGSSHILFEKSPGGAVASAERTAAFRPLVEEAASRYGVDPDTLEAMVFLESGGRPDVIAGAGDPSGAAGLIQIVAGTATDLLGMRVNLTASRRLTNAISEARKRGDESAIATLQQRRRNADQRFEPEAALLAAARYIEIARERFGRSDLAIASYHMGIGNLTTVIDRYVTPLSTAGLTRDIVEREQITYPRLFFDSSPLQNPRAYGFLSGLGDESSLYLWKVVASRELMRLWRESRSELERLAQLQTSEPSSAHILHPPGSEPHFDHPGDLELAGRLAPLAPLADSPEAGFRIDPALGGFADDVEAEPELYRRLRPQALAVLTYIAYQVKRLSGNAYLTVVGAVTDREYERAQAAAESRDPDPDPPQASGWTFEIARDYESDRQAEALQFILDRMQALGLIAYSVGGDTVRITVADDAVEIIATAGA